MEYLDGVTLKHLNGPSARNRATAGPGHRNHRRSRCGQ
jgi:hypothetical protein